MSQELDITNFHLVTTNAEGDVVIGRPPRQPMTPKEAVVFAARIVSMACEKELFEQACKEVDNS